MKTVIITHEIKSYPEWRKVYDEDEVNRKRAGFITKGEYRSVDNPNIITIVGEAPSEEAIKNFMTDPRLKSAMERGGVVGLPDVKILDRL